METLSILKVLYFILINLILVQCLIHRETLVFLVVRLFGMVEI